MVTKEQIQAVADKIAKEFQPEKIILFGSHAWGEPREISDLDFLIVKKTSKKKWEREFELRMKLLGNKFPPLDLLIYTPEEMENRQEMGDIFVQEILQKGFLLYAR